MIAVAATDRTRALASSSQFGATAAQVEAAIVDSAVPTTSLSGKTVTGGCLNASRP